MSSGSGTGAFAGLGLLLAGTLRAETVLALANVLFLGFLVVRGVTRPGRQLPGPLAAVAAALPGEPLSAVVRAALGAPGADLDIGGQLVLLGGWTILLLVAAARTFRWE